FVNGKTFDQKILYITPMLSHVVQVQLKSHICCWMESSREELLTMTKSLRPVFEDMIKSSNPLSENNSAVLMNYVAHVFELYFQDVANKHEKIEDYLDLIEKHTINYLKLQFEPLFIRSLEHKHLTPEYRN